MNRIEALRLLGLDEDATEKDIRVAYKEAAQIVHPDRFASNKKLQDRATEQFKNLQEAYDYLKGKGSRNSHTNSRSSGPGWTTERELEARLSGIAAARVQLARQRDAISDERRSGLIITAVGAVAALIFRWRIPAALAIASAAVVWGIVRTATAQVTISKLDEHIDKLKVEQKELEEQLDQL